jgi:hypothetical protein
LSNWTWRAVPVDDPDGAETAPGGAEAGPPQSSSSAEAAGRINGQSKRKIAQRMEGLSEL